MERALAGQVAVVTGAGRGIGRAIAEAFAAVGAAVVLASRTTADLESVRAGIERGGATAAGVASFGLVAEGAPKDWDAMLAVNLRAVMVSCRAVLPPMLARGRGSIINVASVAASRPIAGAAAYTATKAGVIGFSRVLADELRAGGVRVGVLLPGAVDTPLWDTIPGGPDRARMLRPEDVARAAVLMATLPSGATLEELTLLPAGGIL